MDHKKLIKLLKTDSSDAYAEIRNIIDEYGDWNNFLNFHGLVEENEIEEDITNFTDYEIEKEATERGLFSENQEDLGNLSLTQSMWLEEQFEKLHNGAVT